MPNQNPCRKAFEACGDKGREFQSFLDCRWPEFWCECCSVSVHSIGSVDNNEEVIRLLIHPIHYDSGKLVPAAFDDLTNYDLSVFRISKSSRTEVRKAREDLIARGQAKNPPSIRMIDLVCRASVASIRKQEDAKGRLLAVYDTALESCKGHASIFTRSDMLIDKKSRFRARQVAYEVFVNRIETFETAMSDIGA